MSLLTVSPHNAETIAVGASSAAFTTVLVRDKAYRLVSSTACYVAQGTTPTAAAGAGAARLYVPANVPVDLSGNNGVAVAVIQASAGGFASLTPLTWH